MSGGNRPVRDPLVDGHRTRQQRRRLERDRSVIADNRLLIVTDREEGARLGKRMVATGAAKALIYFEARPETQSLRATYFVAPGPGEPELVAECERILDEAGTEVGLTAVDIARLTRERGVA